MAARVASASGLAPLWLGLRDRGLLPTRHLTVLSYHRVARGEPSPAGSSHELHVTPELFDRQLGILQQYFTLIDTGDLEAHLQGRSLPRNPAMITFDDGYRDNHDEALPILRRRRAKATFFVATRYVTERRLFWWDRLRGVLDRAVAGRVTVRWPERLPLDLVGDSSRQAALETLLSFVKNHPRLDVDRFIGETASACGVRTDAAEEARQAEAQVMSWDHVLALHRAGMDVQSHSSTHRILTTLSDEDTEADLLESRRELESRLGKPILAVAYPGGREPANPEVVRRAGYPLAFTSGTGVVRLDRPFDPLRIPRLAVTRLYGPAFFRGLLAFPSLSYRSRSPTETTPPAGQAPD